MSRSELVIIVKDDSYKIVKTNLFGMDGLPHPHSSVYIV